MDADRYRRLHEIYDAARRLPRARRAPFLQEACADDDELERAALELLEFERGDDGGQDAFDERRIRDGRQRLEAVLDGTDGGDWMPDRIGAYRIVERIGEGGMGVVYAAEQESPRRRVALKLAHPLLATKERLSRFRQEAELLGRLHHPGLAQIFEAGTFDLGRGTQPFFAMEFIEGLDLDSYAAREELDVRARLALVAAVADAVQHAHERGIVHRDLKPDNVMVREDGRPVVLDFGVARATEDSDVASSVQTRAGELLGTLAYMAPEQLGGDPDAVTARADVYALGAIAHELCCGRLPHPIAGLPITEAIRTVTESQARRLGSIDASLRGDVETIVGKALEREPARRYESAAAFAADLRRFLEHRPIAARPPSRVYLARKFARRNKALVGGVLALALGLLVATGFAVFAFIQQGRAERSAAAADAAREETRENLYRAEMLLASEAAHAAGGLGRLRELVDTWREPGQRPDLRGWEWRHFAALAVPRGRVLELDCAPGSIAWHPTLALLAAGGLNGAELVTLPDGEQRERLEFEPELGFVARLAWDPRGERLAICGERSLRVYELDADQRLELLWSRDAVERLCSVGWHPDGGALACLDANGELSILDAADGEPVVARAGRFGREPRALSYDPSGARLAVADAATAIWILDSLTLETVADLRVEPASTAVVTALDWSPDGALVASCGRDGALHLWDVAREREVYAVPAHAGAPMCVRWSLDGARLLSCGDDKTLLEWQPALGVVTGMRRGHQLPVTELSWSPDGARIASCSVDGRIHLWDADDRPAVRTLPFADRRPLSLQGAALAWHPDGRTLFVHRLDNQRVLRLDAGRLEVDERFPPLPVAGPWDAGGRLRAERGPDGLTIRAADDLERVVRELPMPGELGFLAWNPVQPGCLAWAGKDSVWVWDDVEREVEPRRALDLEGVAHSLAWSPDGEWLAVPRMHTLHLVPRAGTNVRALEGLTAIGSGRCAWSRDGARLACSSSSTRVRVLDVETLAVTLEIAGLSHDTRELAWHPDGSRLAIGSDDGSVKLADTGTGELVASLELGERVGAVTWSPDGARLFALSVEGELRMWSAGAAY